MKNLTLMFGVLVIILFPAVKPAYALQNEALGAVMELLKNRDVITRDEYRELITKLEDYEKKQQKKINWVDRFKFSGDIRLRYQGDFMGDNAYLADPSDPTSVLNTYEDRHRARLRLRLNIAARINDDAVVKLRLATGKLDDPVSTNTTLGGYFDSEYFSLDRAYLDWTMPIKSQRHSVKLLAGRMKNPWLSSDLVWDSDVNFEGLAVQYTTQMYPFGFFSTAGVFPLEEVELSPNDKWLYAGQIGAQYRPSEKISTKLAIAYYHFENITGKTNSSYLTSENDYTQPGFQQKGNTLMDISPTGSGEDTLDLALAAQFRELSLMGVADLAFWDPIHVSLMFEVVKNLGFDRKEVSRRAGGDVPDADMAYQVGVEVGHRQVREFGKWSAGLYYKYVKADAVLDAFNDSDFHLGGTNAKGWVLSGNFGLAQNIWLSGKWITTDEIEGAPFATDTLQVDLNGRF